MPRRFARRTWLLGMSIGLLLTLPQWALSQEQPGQNQPDPAAAPSAPAEVIPEGLGTSGFAESGDVRIHYVTKGQGPLLILIHGFPDYWFTWRAQIPALAENYQVVAIDQRGYNQSGQPTGVDSYAMPRLVEDVAAVVRHFEAKQAVIVGHDWGGAVAWSFAMAHPELTERLIILNLPHPRGLLRELRDNPDQRASSAYARVFQQPDAASKLAPELLASWVKDSAAKEQYVAAFRRSSLEGMLNYYKANYPRPPYADPETGWPKIKCPVLMLHGLQDKALLAPALNGTWEWIDNELTLVTIPEAGHFVQQDAAAKVTSSMTNWLRRTMPESPGESKSK